MNSFFVRILLEKLSGAHTLLDLGCGSGELMQTLKEESGIKTFGVERDPDHVLACIEKGLSVIQGDLDDGLAEFSDQSFDYVMLSLTLQHVQDPIFVMHEMLRVGKRIIITFPNFAYWRSRLDLLFGSAPQTPELPYDWYNTPNIRVITIKDFYALCKKEKLKIVEEYGLNPEISTKILFGARVSNIFSNYGLFILEKW